ncbi:hypothetical protein [Sphingobium sp.]|nr:hypothetical protein [Sphingobium sp.]
MLREFCVAVTATVNIDPAAAHSLKGQQENARHDHLAHDKCVRG